VTRAADRRIHASSRGSGDRRSRLSRTQTATQSSRNRCGRPLLYRTHTSEAVPTGKPIHADSLRFLSPSHSLRSVMPIVVAVILSLRSLIRARAAMQLEILALRHQLQVLERSRQPRLRLTAADRLLWVWFSRIWSEWRSALVLVQPATVIAWHRRGFRLFWTWKTVTAPAGRRYRPTSAS